MNLSPEKKKELIEIYDTLMENEEVYYAYPGLYGMVGDWFEMYWDLHNKVLVLMDEEPYEDPQRNREIYRKVKKGKDRLPGAASPGYY